MFYLQLIIGVLWIFQFVHPAYTTMLGHLHYNALESFKTRLEQALHKGEGFAASVCTCTHSCMLEFDHECAGNSRWSFNPCSIHTLVQGHHSVCVCGYVVCQSLDECAYYFCLFYIELELYSSFPGEFSSCFLICIYHITFDVQHLRSLCKHCEKLNRLLLLSMWFVKTGSYFNQKKKKKKTGSYFVLGLHVTIRICSCLC